MFVQSRTDNLENATLLTSVRLSNIKSLFRQTEKKGSYNWSFVNGIHYSDVIVSTMASQATGVSIVYSTVCSGTDQRTAKLRVTVLCEGNSSVTGEFPAERASNAENVSTWWWWRHHDTGDRCILSQRNNNADRLFMPCGRQMVVPYGALKWLTAGLLLVIASYLDFPE